MLDPVRALLAGEAVTRRGRFTSLEARAITPPPAPVPLAVSAAAPRALDVVRRHADIWDANVPPLRERLRRCASALGRALPTWCWVFARPGADARRRARATTAATRPGSATSPDARSSDAILCGEPRALPRAARAHARASSSSRCRSSISPGSTSRAPRARSRRSPRRRRRE